MTDELIKETPSKGITGLQKREWSLCYLHHSFDFRCQNLCKCDSTIL